MGEKHIGWNRKVVTRDAYCHVLKHLNYEFTNCTNKQKNLIGFCGGRPGNQLYHLENGSPSIYPADLHKLYYMLTRIVGKAKFLFVQDFKVNK